MSILIVQGDRQICFTQSPTQEQIDDFLQGEPADYQGHPNDLPEAIRARFAPENKPDWDNFIDALNNVEGFTGLLMAHPLYAMLISRMGALATATSWKGQDDRLILWWNSAPLNVDATIQAAMQLAADANNIPLVMDPNRTISAR